MKNLFPHILTTILACAALTPVATAAPGVDLGIQAPALRPAWTRALIFGSIPCDSIIPAGEATADGPEVNTLFFEGTDTVAAAPADTVAVPDPALIRYSSCNPLPLGLYRLRTPIYSGYELLDPIPMQPAAPLSTAVPAQDLLWLSRAYEQDLLMRRVQQDFFVNHPELLVYDASTMKTPPKEFTVTIDPSTARVLIKEMVATKEMPQPELQAKYRKKHWLHDFNANLQFSQAFISPNWYQGGNNNLNALLNVYYNVKLNPAFHTKLLFENTVQYKLGMNNAPDDELRDYNISQDLFQWNMTAGFRSSRRWYYSVTSQFKTQLLNNYKPNTTKLTAAFLSPAELNVGVGMTYNYANKPKTFSFDASISPLSYNLKTCTRRRLNVKGIETWRITASEYGSSAEGKLQWKPFDYIQLRSRIFAFTDYEYIQGDWENTIEFTINRFLTTQIFVHMRYDSSAEKPEDEITKWHKLQMKEILSFGFTYKFQS